MIPLDTLLVTQGDIRYRDQIAKMAAFICKGGFWTQEVLEAYAQRHNLPRVSPLIQISEFDDGQRFIHDGHHRGLSTYLGCRDYLRDDEYVITRWSYPSYLEIAPANGWFTPFDPRVHLRAADFGAFKQAARRLYQAHVNGVGDLQDVYDFIQEKTGMYRLDRGNLRTVADLAEATNFQQLGDCHVV